MLVCEGYQAYRPRTIGQECSRLYSLSPIFSILRSRSATSITDIRQVNGIITLWRGEVSIARMDSGGALAREESSRSGLPSLYSQQMDAEFSKIAILYTEDALQVVIADSSIVSTSTKIAKKHLVSHKDKNFESLDMQDKALRVSNLLSLVDGSRKRPAKTASNQSGDVDEAIVDTMVADGLPSYVVIAADDCYKYIAFTFMVSMINKDMHHTLLESICKDDPVKIY